MFKKRVIAVAYNGRVWCASCALRFFGEQLATRTTDDERQFIGWVERLEDYHMPLPICCAGCRCPIQDAEPRDIPAYMTADDILQRYPRIVAHVICDSLGYASPRVAALVVQDARSGRSNYCEWVTCVYAGSARTAVQHAIRTRHEHSGFMAEYRRARELIRRYLDNEETPVFMSW